MFGAKPVGLALGQPFLTPDNGEGPESDHHDCLGCIFAPIRPIHKPYIIVVVIFNLTRFFVASLMNMWPKANPGGAEND